MASRGPPKRLVDIFKQTSPQQLNRHAAQAQRAMESISANDMETRYTRNMLLVDPKTLHLLIDHDTMNAHKMFAVYKPPFCPMRRADSGGNYHRVSVESFVHAALKSRDVSPAVEKMLMAAQHLQEQEDDKLKKTVSTPPSSSSSIADPLQVRILNEFPLEYSGPVMVSLSATRGTTTGGADAAPALPTLRRGSVHYDVLVFGHEVPRQTSEPIPVSALFPNHAKQTASSSSSEASSNNDNNEMRCTVKVERIGYYAVHAVSLLRVSIFNPVTSSAPLIEQYIRDHRKSFVVGDLKAYEDKKLMNSGGNALRGDFDLPRLFVHARSVSVDIDVLDPNGNVVGSKPVEYSCKNCFEPLVQPERSMMMKRMRIQLIDGSWSPRML